MVNHVADQHAPNVVRAHVARLLVLAVLLAFLLLAGQHIASGSLGGGGALKHSTSCPLPAGRLCTSGQRLLHHWWRSQVVAHR